MISVQPIHYASIQPIGQQALGTSLLRLMIEYMMTYVSRHRCYHLNQCALGTSLATRAQSSGLYMASVFTILPKSETQRREEDLSLLIPFHDDRCILCGFQHSIWSRIWTYTSGFHGFYWRNEIRILKLVAGLP